MSTHRTVLRGTGVLTLAVALALTLAVPPSAVGATETSDAQVDLERLEQMNEKRDELANHRDTHVPGELLVTTETAGDTGWASATDYEPKHQIADRVQLVEVSDGGEEVAAAQIQAQSGVEAVEPVLTGWFTEVPDDEYYDQQWSHGFTNAEQGWDITTGSSDSTVVIADTGIESDHPDLAAVVGDQWYAGDGVLEEGVDGDSDHAQDGHSTAVAGIDGAAGNHGIGVAGAAWESNIEDVNVSNETGVPTTSGVVASIAHAADIEADAINLSLAFGSLPCPHAIQSVIDDAADAGTAVVIASGNH